MSGVETSTEIVTDEAGLRALRPEWDALWTSVNGQHHESFDAAWLAFTRVAKPQGRRLVCLVRRQQGKLVLVWPMVAHTRLFCTVLRPLGPGTADYTVVLVADVPNKLELLTESWRALRAFARPDLSYLPYLAVGSELHTLASREPDILSAEPDSNAIASLRGETDWPSFHKKLGALPGMSSAQLTRRLQKSGNVELKVLGHTTPRAELTELVDWMLAKKREWAERTEKYGPWLSSPQFREYLIDLLDVGERPETALLFVIAVDGKPVGITMCGVGKQELFGVLSGFDADYARCSPGKLVLEFILRWCLEHDYDFDLGVGSEPHKSYWSRNNIKLLWSYEYANTRWGRLSARGKQLEIELKAKLKQLREKRQVLDKPASDQANKDG